MREGGGRYQKWPKNFRLLLWTTPSRRAQCTQYFISHALWMSTANQASHPTTKVISIVDFKTLACLELENMFDLKNKQTFCTGNKV